MSTQVATVKQEMQKFEAQMKGYEDTILKLVGNKYGVSADEFAISVMTAVKKSPKLLQCDRASLFAAVPIVTHESSLSTLELFTMTRLRQGSSSTLVV